MCFHLVYLVHDLHVQFLAGHDDGVGFTTYATGTPFQALRIS